MPGWRLDRCSRTLCRRGRSSGSWRYLCHSWAAQSAATFFEVGSWNYDLQPWASHDEIYSFGQLEVLGAHRGLDFSRHAVSAGRS